MTEELYPIKNRYIDITPQLRVGYNYLMQKFYVTNTDTELRPYTTYRSNAEDIIQVLGALGITEETYPEVIEKIPYLKSLLEKLTHVYYTLQDTGAYIHTLQFNDHADHPLVLDCEKAKLYIMNSTVIYDLTLNESPRNIRIPRIISYYKEILGLDLEDPITSNENNPHRTMEYFYSLLVSYYYPTCYNQVALNPETNEYFYNNKFLLSNYSNTSNATYICTYNPNNNSKDIHIGYVSSTDTATSEIKLVEPIPTSSLQGYNSIILEGATTTTEDTDTTYSADGEYTINSLILKEEESPDIIEGFKTSSIIPYSYNFPFKELYVGISNYYIKSMSREQRTITLNSVAEDILIGDIILVTGAFVTSPNGLETISCNGTYTVENIANLISNGSPVATVLTVEEEIPTDFSTTETTARVIKELYSGYISNINNKTISLLEPIGYNLPVNSAISIHTTENGILTINFYNIETATEETDTTITIQQSISNPYNYADTCPKVYVPVPLSLQGTMEEDTTEILIDVTSVSENAEEIFPMGEFLVNGFTQCQKYFNTLSGLVTPNSTIRNNLYKKLEPVMTLEPIPNITTPKIGDTINPPDNISYIEFKGLYSKIYSE